MTTPGESAQITLYNNGYGNFFETKQEAIESFKEIEAWEKVCTILPIQDLEEYKEPEDTKRFREFMFYILKDKPSILRQAAEKLEQEFKETE